MCSMFEFSYSCNQETKVVEKSACTIIFKVQQVQNIMGGSKDLTETLATSESCL